MVFISGPRQVGKTTLAKTIGDHLAPAIYFNWDNVVQRRRVLALDIPRDAKLLIFDENHKYRPWKRHLKGIFDSNEARQKILVTGSARLDVYRRGGDSLMGRYHPYRLHPFSVAEALGENPESKARPGQDISIADASPAGREAFETLLRFEGFPEPFCLTALAKFGQRKYGAEKQRSRAACAGRAG